MVYGVHGPNAVTANNLQFRIRSGNFDVKNSTKLDELCFHRRIIDKSIRNDHACIPAKRPKWWPNQDWRPRKCLLQVWWDWNRIINYQRCCPMVKRSIRTSTCQQLDRLKAAIDQKRLELANMIGDSWWPARSCAGVWLGDSYESSPAYSPDSSYNVGSYSKFGLEFNRSPIL